DRFDSHKIEASLAIGAELTTQIHIGLFGVLLLIQAIFVGFPDIEQRAWNRRAIGGKYTSHHDSRVALAILADCCPQWHFWCTFAVEWPEDRTLGCAVRQAMIDGINQHRGTGDIGEQNK